MSVAAQFFTNDHLVNILSRIKLTEMSELNKLTESNVVNIDSENNDTTEYKCYDDYKLIIANKNESFQKIKSFESSDEINMGSNFVVFNTQGKEIVSFINNQKIDEDAINDLKILSENEWKIVEINKLQLHTKHICLFYNIDSWYVAYSNTIEKFQYVSLKDNVLNELTPDDIQTPQICYTDKIIKLLCNYFASKFIDLDVCNKNLVYHLLLRDNEFKQNNLGSISKPIETTINLLWICDKYCKIANPHSIDLTDEIVNKIQYEKKVHFSCLDELLMSIEFMNNEDVSTKNIQFGGYMIKLFDKLNNINKLYCIRTNIFKYITSILPKYDNQYKSFLELYQNDKLTDVLPYLHKYPADVIRRINMSVKILSKEILNIYHLTRKKQNKELYESLPLSYRKVLYDLHKIYVNQKHGEFITKSFDLLKEKKSVSVDIVYSYLKGIRNNELIKLFDERRTLLNDLKKINFKYDEIMSVTNIDIITQTELMFLH